MKIEQILIQPIGQRINPGMLSIKTYKKTWQAGDIWWSQVILMDETGEMPADVNVGKTYNPIRGRGQKINIIIAEVQEAEYLGKDRKKLVVDQYTIPTMSIAEYETKQDEMDDEVKLIVQGKIRHGLVCAFIHSKQIEPDMTSGKEHIPKSAKAVINEIVEFIMTGE